jgi:xylulokinase
MRNDLDTLLSLDAGTTSVKAGIFSTDGTCLGISRREYQLDTPSADRAQLNPEVYWQACLDTVRSVISEAGVSPERVIAMAVSSQGETTITLDANGRVIYPALVWLDNRAADQAAALAERFGAQAYARTGIPEIVPTWPACKILWLRQNEPDVFTRAAKFILVQDYLIHRLTGRMVTDGSIACTTMYYDILDHGWWDEVLETIGIDADQLPQILPSGSVVEYLTPQAAGMLGLTTRTLVVNGGMDQSVGAIGAGNIQPGIVSETTGAALTMDASCTVPVYVHSVPGRYLFVPVCPTAGMALKWLRDTFFQDVLAAAERERVDAYDRLTELAEAVEPGADGLVMLPHLMGAFSPEANPDARGSFTGFSLRHNRVHFIRALLEGVAFMLRRNLEAVEKAGITVHEIRSTGGGARSKLWNQIKASVCNRTIVTLQNEETGLLGDAVLAGVAACVFSSIDEGCQIMVKVRERIPPDTSVQQYETIYRNYCELDRRLSGFFTTAHG